MVMANLNISQPIQKTLITKNHFYSMNKYVTLPVYFFIAFLLCGFSPLKNFLKKNELFSWQWPKVEISWEQKVKKYSYLSFCLYSRFEVKDYYFWRTLCNYMSSDSVVRFWCHITACQLIWGYFMRRDLGIAFIFTFFSC